MKIVQINNLPENADLKERWHRHDVIRLLEGDGKTGIELGVAEGIFSERMVNTGRFQTFFGVDMYADIHDVDQYKRALKRVGLIGPYKLLKMRFDQALDLFEDGSLDFIYVDGYAHSGEEGGETIFEWFRKLKVGGVMAGDDYSDEWPLVVKAVNEFVRQTGLKLYVTGQVEENSEYCLYPSWAVVKEREIEVAAVPEMVAEGKAEAVRIARIRGASPMWRQLRAVAKRVLPESVVNRLKGEKR